MVWRQVSLRAGVFDGVNNVNIVPWMLKPVDPVGAGDAFVAGFLGGLLEIYTLKGFLEK